MLVSYIDNRLNGAADQAIELVQRNVNGDGRIGKQLYWAFHSFVKLASISGILHQLNRIVVLACDFADPNDTMHLRVSCAYYHVFIVICLFIECLLATKFNATSNTNCPTNQDSWIEKASSFASRHFPFLNAHKKLGDSGYCSYLHSRRNAHGPFFELALRHLVEPGGNFTGSSDAEFWDAGSSSCVSYRNISELEPFKVSRISDCSKISLPQLAYIIDAGLMGILSDRCIETMAPPVINHLTPYLLEKMAEQRPSALLFHWDAICPFAIVQTRILYTLIISKQENADLCCYLKASDFQHCSSLSMASSLCLSKMLNGPGKCRNLSIDFFLPNHKPSYSRFSDRQMEEWIQKGRLSQQFVALYSKKPPLLENFLDQSRLRSIIPFRIIASMGLECFDSLPTNTKQYLWENYREYFMVANSGIFERRADHMDKVTGQDTYKSMAYHNANSKPQRSDASEVDCSFVYILSLLLAIINLCS